MNFIPAMPFFRSLLKENTSNKISIFEKYFLKSPMPKNTPREPKNFLSTKGQLCKMPVISEELMKYLFDRCNTPHTGLKSVRDSAKEDSWEFMLTSPDQASFLALLINLSKPKKILEVGCYLGHSTITMAAAAGPDCKIYSIDFKQARVDAALSNFHKFGFQNQIDLRCGNAHEIIQQLKTEWANQVALDFVFIDADKINSLNYYKATIDQVKPGGIVVVDNVLWRGHITDRTINCERSEALRELNDYVMNDSRVSSFILTVSDGMLIARKL